MNDQNIVCPSCGSKPIEGIKCLDGGSSICSNKNCKRNFHYCHLTNKAEHTTPLECCHRMKNELLCPSCGSEPIEGEICKDGGSSICSNRNCGKTFHYCKKTNKIEDTIPLDCCHRF